MLRRIVSGLLVGGAWLLALRFMPAWLLILILCIMSCACQVEFYGMLKKGRPKLPSSAPWGIAMGSIWLACTFLFPVGSVGELYALPVLGALIAAFMIRVLFYRGERPVEYMAITLFGFFYLPFLLSFIIRLAQWGCTEIGQILPDRSGIYLALYLAAVVKFSDIGGLAFGIPFGKHKLAPSISPKKSWEGLLGGIFFSIIVSISLALIARYVPCGGPLKSMPIWVATILGVFLALAGLLGDLVESRIKREAEIKDSAGLLPGMGGILDMFDSLAFAPVIFYILLRILSICNISKFRFSELKDLLLNVFV